ncbi:MAG: hypothetical protein ACU0D1_19575 [Pseudooceanicola nanhaiensis]
MKRSMFNDPRPKGFEELFSAMDELGMDADVATATLEEEPGADGFGGHGYSAEVFDYDSEDERIEFSTLAYDTKEELIADLKAVGIQNFE